ncbi:MAG: S41 family peptidase [Patescibacteria group bacterium]|nr:S41 family peptidase [Patescibacteria group bacterium]
MDQREEEVKENKKEESNQKLQTDLTQLKWKSSSSKNYFWFVVMLVLVFYIGTAWGGRQKVDFQEPSGEVASFLKNLSDPKDLFDNPEKNKPDKVDFDIFWEAWKELDQKYIDEDKLDSQKRVYGAINGMVKALDDPYSGFMDPEQTRDFNTDMEGKFEGIGAELGVKDNILTIIAPIEGMPAEAAGLRSGDRIIKIDGKVAADITIDEAVKKIRGSKGTEVVLSIFRNGEDMTRDITIVRDTIEVKSVEYEIKEDGIAYIKIIKFSQDTDKEFNKIVTQVIADNTRGIVLDVRNNPGGFLDVAVEMISKFVSKGKVVVWEQGRDDKKVPYKAKGGDSLVSLPIVALVNEGSASASEILAGALRDIKKAELIGKKTFGKGSVQQLEDLHDGSSMRITIAKWLTPSGQSIHEVGLDPDIEVEITNDDYENDRDPQFDRAMEEIRKKIQ